MKWLLSLVVFAVVLTGAFSPALAGPGGKGGKSNYYETIGVAQPKPNSEKAMTPPAVELVAPRPLAKVTGSTLDLKWKAIPGVPVYHVQVATDAKFKWIFADNHNVQGDSFQLNGLEPGQQYFWRVAARFPENDPSYTKGPFANGSFEVKK